tara:strand:- start:2409 stop:3887 length:1479 start_codon:yes stop_codon:yes gene_type:complete
MHAKSIFSEVGNQVSDRDKCIWERIIEDRKNGDYETLLYFYGDKIRKLKELKGKGDEVADILGSYDKSLSELVDNEIQELSSRIEDMYEQGLDSFFQRHESIIGEKLKESLGCGEDFLYFPDITDEDTGELIFKSNGQIKKITIVPLNKGYENFDMDDIIDIAISSNLLGFPTLPGAKTDQIYVEPNGDKFFMLRESEGNAATGNVATRIKGNVMSLFDQDGYESLLKLVFKSNPNEGLTQWETYRLNGIRNNERLKKEDIRATAPKVLAYDYSTICTEYIDLPSLTDFYKTCTDDKKLALERRRQKAIQAIEADSLKYIEGKEIDLEAALKYHADSNDISPLGESFIEAEKVLEANGGLNLFQSDAKEANWKYDEKEDMLYLMDENLVRRGNEYFHLVRVDSRVMNEVLMGIGDQEELGRAYLSIVMSCAQSLCFTFKRNEDTDLVLQREEQINTFLDKLETSNSTYAKHAQPMKQDLKKILNQDTHTGTA